MAAQTPTPANVDRMASLSAELESGARTVREEAEALAESTRTSALALKRIQAGVSVSPRPARVEPQGLSKAPEEELSAQDVELRGIPLVEVSFAAPAADAFDVKGTETATPDMALEAFFEQVSKSVLNAQRRLDMASLAYSQDLTDSPIPPSLFSIPRVTAEIKLGLSVAENSNLLVAIFGRPESTTNFSESTVSFDVVATPPPPGGPGIYNAPIPSFLVVGDERERLATALAGMNGAIRSKTGDDLSGPRSDWILLSAVFRAGSDVLPQASCSDYLFIKRGATPDRPVFTVRLRLDKPNDAKIVNITDPDLKLAIFDLVAKVREWESLVTLPTKS